MRIVLQNIDGLEVYTEEIGHVDYIPKAFKHQDKYYPVTRIHNDKKTAVYREVEVATTKEQT